MLDTFYTTVAQASFTLLALWWVLLQIRHDEWISDTAYRRSVYDVSLYFLLPGMMSLASLLAVEEAWIWRANFAIFGSIGVVESVWLLARRGRLRAAAPFLRAADVLSVVLYGLVALVALWEKLPEELGIDLRPLELEGIFVAALLLLGVTLAALIFVSTGPHVDRSGQAERMTG
jgi:hypothetical protein